jgi:hypothetical protein
MSVRIFFMCGSPNNGNGVLKSHERAPDENPFRCLGGGTAHFPSCNPGGSDASSVAVWESP